MNQSLVSKFIMSFVIGACLYWMVTNVPGLLTFILFLFSSAIGLGILLCMGVAITFLILSLVKCREKKAGLQDKIERRETTIEGLVELDKINRNG